MSRQNPQLEDGYTKIANDLVEGILLSGLGMAELKITLAIIRQTYGWNKKMEAISLTTFNKLTGLGRRHIVRALKFLEVNDFIFKARGATMKFGKPVHKYGINKKRYAKREPVLVPTREPLTGAKREHIKERNKLLNKMRVEIGDKFSMPK